MFSLLGERQIGQKRAEEENVILDDDVRKLDRLMLINTSARYELIAANDQVIDFHLNRVMKAKVNKNKKKELSSSGPSQNIALKHRGIDIASTVIGELPEAEDQINASV